MYPGCIVVAVEWMSTLNCCSRMIAGKAAWLSSPCSVRLFPCTTNTCSCASMRDAEFRLYSCTRLRTEYLPEQQLVVLQAAHPESVIRAEQLNWFTERELAHCPSRGPDHGQGFLLFFFAGALMNRLENPSNQYCKNVIIFSTQFQTSPISLFTHGSLGNKDQL